MPSVGVAVACGLGALIAVSELAYDLLKYCGAAYLCWLGIGMLLHPRKGMATSESTGNRQTNWLLKGMTGNMLNPKVGIFYVSFLPQFIPQGHSLFFWTLGLVGIHMLLGITWLMTLIAATRPLSRFSIVRGWLPPWIGSPASYSSLLRPDWLSANAEHPQKINRHRRFFCASG